MKHLGIYLPTDATIKAIKKLCENGFFVCFTTSRAKYYAPKKMMKEYQ